jgi:hypothetical protein
MQLPDTNRNGLQPTLLAAEAVQPQQKLPKKDVASSKTMRRVLGRVFSQDI